MRSKPSSPSSRHRTPGYRLHGESLEPREMLTFNPSGFEQAYMESINRFRTDPQGELSVIFSNINTLTARDPATNAAIDFFNVDRDLLLAQWSELTAVPPVAYNEDLYDAALKHTNLMAQFDEQAHDLPGELGLGERIRAEGYSLRRATENIYAFAENHIHGHAGFIVDWGEGPGGIQDPAGHRDNYLDSGVDEVGIAVISENNQQTDVGPFLVTQDFGRRSGYEPQVLGVVYNDINTNGIYDPGEGLGNVNITVRGDAGTFTTQTLTAGGYQVVVPDGNYQVFASGAGLAGTFVVGNVVMNSENVKADFETRTAATAPTAVADTVNLSEDTSVSFVVTTNDIAGGGVIVNNSVQIVREARNGTTTIDASGRIRYTPNTDFSGTDSLTYTVRDTNGGTSNIGTVTLNVNGSADPPQILPSFSGTATVIEDGQVNISLSAFITDSDGDIDWNTLTVTSGPTNGQAVANPSGRNIVYTPNNDFVGNDSLAFQISDATGLTSDITTVTITVNQLNDRPIATDDFFTAVDRSSATLAILSNDSDPDGSLANGTIQILTPPAVGTATIVGSNLQVTTPSGFVGRSEIRYRIQDEAGALSDPATVTLYTVQSQSTPWHNPHDRFDVTGDGILSPLDALTVINVVGQSLPVPAPGVTRGVTGFVDVAADNLVTPLDALQVINVLNNGRDGATSNAALSASVTDDLFAEDDEEESDANPDQPFWAIT